MNDRERSPAPRSDLYLALSLLDDETMRQAAIVLGEFAMRQSELCDRESLRRLVDAAAMYVAKWGDDG